MNIGMSNSVEEITLSSSFTWRQYFNDNSGFCDALILGKYCGVSVWWPGPWRWWTTRPLVWSTGWGGRCRNFSNFSCNGREAWNRSPSSTSRKSYFHWKSCSTTLLQLWISWIGKKLYQCQCILSWPGAEVDDGVIFPHNGVKDPDQEEKGLLQAHQVGLEPLAYEDDDWSTLLVNSSLCRW